MELRVDVDEDLLEELAEEARLQGFDDTAAYFRWILANRPMSALGSSQAPALASQVADLEERLSLVEREIGLEGPIDPGADLGSSASTPATDGELDAPPAADGEPEESAAADDDIAEAIGDVAIEDESEGDGLEVDGPTRDGDAGSDESAEGDAFEEE